MDITLKQPCNVSVRVPEWVQKINVAVTVAGEPRPIRWNGQYLGVGEGKPQEKVSIAFPMEERTQREIIGAKEYMLTLKGNDVVAIDPPGKYCPYYQREKYRKGEVQWKNVERFVSKEELVI